MFFIRSGDATDVSESCALQEQAAQSPEPVEFSVVTIHVSFGPDTGPHCELSPWRHPAGGAKEGGAGARVRAFLQGLRCPVRTHSASKRC